MSMSDPSGPLRTTRLVGVIVLFALLTAALTWPMLDHPFTQVIGPPGDNFYFAWLTEWYYRSMVELGQSPLYVPFLNAPTGWSLAYNEMSPGIALLGLPAAPFGPAASYNLAVFLSFVLTGVFTYLWVHRLTGSPAAALVAATCFAFTPYRLIHALGHLNLLGTQWLPLYFWGLTALIAGRGSSMKPAVGAAASLVLIAATSQYYLYMSLLASVPIAAVLLSSRSQWHRDAVLLKRAAVAAAIAIPGVALAVWPYISLAQQGALPRRSLAEARVWFASPTDYLLPSALHPVVGNWMAAHFDQRRLVETTLQLSVVALALAALAVWRTWRSADGPITRALVWATVVAFVLSLGMELHWLGELVTIPVPAALQPWIGVPETWIPLPGHLLFDWLPYYASMRAWTRWGLFVALFVSVLAGIGFAQIVRSITARRAAVFGVLVLAIVLFEYRQRPYMTSEIEPRPLDTWLSDQPEGLLVEIPAITMAMPQQTLQTRYHRQPFVGAFFSAFLSPEFTRVEAALRGFPDEASLSMLRELDVRWVMVDVSQFPDKPALMEASRQAGLTLRAEVGAQAVFERR